MNHLTLERPTAASLRPRDFLRAARVPETVQPGEYGVWQLERVRLDGPEWTPVMRAFVGGPSYTLLRRHTYASIHLNAGEIVMEDSRVELSKHLPIWMTGRGRILKTGLGLGCVVRGLLLKPEVEMIDVVEIDKTIINLIGPEFVDDPRVQIHHADAFAWDFGDRRWDYAWHDIWCEGNDGLEVLHANLMERFAPGVPWDRQGAWAFPREVANGLPFRLIGQPRTPRNRQ